MVLRSKINLSLIGRLDSADSSNQWEINGPAAAGVINMKTKRFQGANPGRTPCNYCHTGSLCGCLLMIFLVGSWRRLRLVVVEPEDLICSVRP